MKRNFRILLVLALAFAMLLSACQPRDLASENSKSNGGETTTADNPDARTTNESKPAPNPGIPPKSFKEIRNWTFSTVDIDGNPVNESIFAEAKLTMVNIWATWCPPCIAEIPHIGELAKKEFADMNIQVVGIVTDAEYGGDNEVALADAKAILEQSGALYLNIQADYANMYDSLLKFVEGYPTTIFLDSQGNIVGPEIVGMRSKAAFLEEAQQRLAMLND